MSDLEAQALAAQRDGHYMVVSPEVVLALLANACRCD